MDDAGVRTPDAAPTHGDGSDRAETYFDVADIIMIALDDGGRVARINRLGLQVLGYQEAELVGRNWFDTCIPARQREAVRAVFALIMAGDLDPAERYENHVLTRGGAERLIAWHNAILRNDEGKIVGTLSSGTDITERRKAEESLCASELRYRSLVEHMGEGLMQVDNDDRILFVNGSLCQMLGWSPEDLLGRIGHEALCVDESGRDMIKQKNRSRLDGVSDVYETTMRRADGAVMWVSISGAPVYGPDGAVAGSVGLITDITERKRVEDALRKSEADLRKAQRVANVGSWTWHIPSNRLEWSDQMYRIFGIEKEAFTGDLNEVVAHAIHPDDRVKVEQSNLSVIRDGKPIPVEYRVVWPDGTVRVVWAEAGELVRDVAGKPLLLKGIAQDLTERKRVEESLRANEAFSQAVIENSPIGISVRSRTGRLLSANTAWKRIWAMPEPVLVEDTGRQREELTFNHRDDYLRPYQAEVRRVYEHGGNLRIPELRVGHFRPGAAEWVSQHFYAIPDPEGNVDRVVILTEDITERKRAEREREELHAQLLQARKLESVGRLAGGVAHDFNNMLQVILGHTDLALAKTDGSHPLHADLQHIHRAATRATELTRQLLAFARRQTVVPRVLDLNETVEGMLSMLRRLIGEDISLIWIPGERLWNVRMDPAQIDQILANLCVNARDAIGGVGTVTIETGNAIIDSPRDPGHPEIEPGSYVMLTVSDTGCGMEKEVLDHLFEPFFTTKGHGQGTGLGLSTVYGIVKQNEGFIHVVSEPGTGTTFEVYLPWCGGDVEAGTSTHEEHIRPGSAETILLVEDDHVILQMGTLMLEGLGYRVIATTRPTDAIRLAESHEGPIDVLITDVVMPEMNGRDLAARIVALKPRVKCLFMSGYPADVIAHRGVVVEGVHFMAKPFTVGVLAEKVRETLEG